MANAYKIYDYVFDPTLMTGIELIALVENPAIEILAVQLSKEIEVFEFKLASEEQRVLVSPVLVPDQLIYRNNINGEPAYVRASKETIAKLQEHFVTMGNQKNSNIEHSGALINGIVFTEQWIVQDSTYDTINSYGFSKVPVGSWCVKAKLSQELWDEYVKSGKVKGFSVEGMLGIKETNNKTIKFKKMDKNTIEQIIKDAVAKITFEAEIVEEEITDEVIETEIVQSEEIVNEEIIETEIVQSEEVEVIENVELTEEIVNIEVVETEVELASNFAGKPAEDIASTGATSGDTASVTADPTASGATSGDTSNLSVSGDTGTLPTDGTLPAEPDGANLNNKIIDLESKIIELEAIISQMQDELEINVALSKETPASSGIKDVPINVKYNGEETMIEMLKRLQK